MTWLSVVWQRTELRRTAEQLVVAEVARRCGRSPGQVSVGRLCAGCGSARHGRPYVVPWSASAQPGVSLSRTTGVALAAVANGQWVGADVEAVARFGDPGVAGVLLHPDEHADGADDLAVVWVRKEALLKATGRGLATDPATVRVSAAGEDARVLAWPDGPAGPRPTWLVDVDLAPGLRAAVAGTGVRPAQVSVRQAAGEGSRG